MGQSAYRGRKTQMSGGLTPAEVAKYTRNVPVDLRDGDRLVFRKGLPFLEAPLFTDATWEHRATNKSGDLLRDLYAICVILRKDGTWEVKDLSLSFIAGEDVFSEDSVSVERGKTGNLYFAYERLTRIPSTMFTIPLIPGANSFDSDFTLICDGNIEGFGKLPISESFEQKNMVYVNTESIKNLYESGQSHALRTIRRPKLLKCSNARLNAAQERALQIY